MNQQAIEKIKKIISQIKYQGPDDEAAAEWQGHLEWCMEDLKSGKITVAMASDSLGINLEDKQ